MSEEKPASKSRRAGKRKVKQAFASHIGAIAQSGDGSAAVLSEGVDASKAASILLDEKNFPKKRFFRSRAHCNPLSHNDGFDYPLSPEEANWSIMYPNIPEQDRVVRVLDIEWDLGVLQSRSLSYFRRN